MISLQKTVFSSSCAEHGRPKVTAVLKSPQVTESSAPLYHSGKPLLHTEIEHQSMTKDRFLRIFETLRYHGMRAPRVISRSSVTIVHHIVAYQSG
jgi:hypothetical protein